MSRDLVRLALPPGPQGVARLLPALAAALDGSGPAIAPLPEIGATAAPAYVATLDRAVRADGTALESQDVAVVVATSGSTGAPKGVLLTAANLTAMTAAVHGAGRPQWVAALPVTSMGGLNVVVRALAADREPIAVASLAGAAPFTPAAFADAVDRAHAVAADVRTSLVPAQVSRLLGDAGGQEALRGCTQVLVGGAALPPDLLSRARALDIAIVTTYGATETAGGCVFDGRPLPGIEVTTDATGRLTIAGPCVALGYRADPVATAESFHHGRFVLPDLGTIAPDGLVTVIGRVDDIVVIRGVNVSTSAVEAVLAAQSGVDSAAVVAAPGPDGDPRLVAFVVGTTDPTHLQDTVTSTLGVAARPRVALRTDLPYLPGGKVDRVALRTQAAGQDVD